jgi:hypothetical protein
VKATFGRGKKALSLGSILDLLQSKRKRLKPELCRKNLTQRREDAKAQGQETKLIPEATLTVW